MDFPTLMVAAAALTGGIWLLDAWLWAPKRRLAASRVQATAEGQVSEELVRQALKEPVLVEYAKSFFPIILAVLVLRSFVVEPFRIPSGSMLPTLHVGDFILVNKFTYGLRLPVANTKILELGEPQRGDVVVFRFPKDPKVDYIKRVVGLPGDTVRYVDKTLYINGEAVPVKPEGSYLSPITGMPVPGMQLYLEDLDGVRHHILIDAGRPGIDTEMRVPAGHYFVMGDNRDNSNDSRFWGTVPEENLVGKAFFIWMHFNLDQGGIDWNRIGKSIH